MPVSGSRCHRTDWVLYSKDWDLPNASTMANEVIWSSNVPVKKFELHARLQEKNFAIIDANRFFATSKMTTDGQVGQVSIGIF